MQVKYIIQVTGFYVNLSLLPVMGGLAICSANELSFNMMGFIAALATNISECGQNVYSKMLISGDAFKYTPAEMQFYTSAASLVVALPVGHGQNTQIHKCNLIFKVTLFLVPLSVLLSTSMTLAGCLLMNGMFFHGQTISAYYLMDYISPVTHRLISCQGYY